MEFRKRLLLISLLSITATSHASLDSARSIETRSQNEAVAAQAKVDASAEKTLQYRAELEQLQQEIDNLSIYRDHLQTLTQNQASELVSLENQIEEIKTTRQGVVPLMYRMLDGLKTIVENDRPLRSEQRRDRIQRLENMMTQADVADAEKYRRILEAWQIEIDYGTKLGTYQAPVEITGETRRVDILYVGRIVLVAKSLDNNHFWTWNDPSQQWEAVDNQQAKDIGHAFALANRQVAPSLLTLPVSAKGMGQ